MPLFIDDLTADVQVSGGDLPLDDAQIARIAAAVAEKLASRKQSESLLRKTAEIRSPGETIHSATPSLGRHG